jgi:hypothetical protein
MSETLRGLDAWLTTDPRDRDNLAWDAPATYHCRDCGWTGRAAGAGDHHRATGHTITVLGLVVPFSCCPEGTCQTR